MERSSRPPLRVARPLTGAALALCLLATAVTAAPTAGAQQELLCFGLPVTVNLAAGDTPTASADVILGTDFDDVIAGGDGPDVICGGLGNDRIWGQAGDDRLSGGPGDDVIRGGDGEDIVLGEDGVDNLAGGRGDDFVNGGPSADELIRGNTGDDYLVGGDGSDTLIAGNGGEDIIFGEAGDEVLISGGPRPDILFGGEGNDTIKGLGGSDDLFGGPGNDELRGGDQRDYMNAGDGIDSCIGGLQLDYGRNCELEVSTDGPVPDDRGFLDRTVAQVDADIARTVAEIQSNGWGVGDDNVLRGPGGWEVDLNDCPDGWSDTAGVEPGAIRLAHVGPHTEPGLAAFGDGIAAWMSAAEVGEGATAQQIDLTQFDDLQNRELAISWVQQLIAQDNVLAVSTLGTDSSLAVRDLLNDACIPQPLVQSSLPAWNDPVGSPWTTPSQMTTDTEALIWMRWIEQNLADQAPVSVAISASVVDFGFIQAFEAAAIASPVIGDVQIYRHDFEQVPVLPGLTVTEPDVVLVASTGISCAQAISEATARWAQSDAALLASRDCRGSLRTAGDDADGWLSLDGGLINFDATQFGSRLSFVVDNFLFWYGIEPNGATRYGALLIGWTWETALLIAAELAGGVSRSNLMLALRVMDLNQFALQPTGSLRQDAPLFTMNGTLDASPIEQSTVQRWYATTQEFATVGVINVDGQTPNCMWIGDIDGACSDADARTAHQRALPPSTVPIADVPTQRFGTDIATPKRPPVLVDLDG